MTMNYVALFALAWLYLFAGAALLALWSGTKPYDHESPKAMWLVIFVWPIWLCGLALKAFDDWHRGDKIAVQTKALLEEREV